MFDILYLSIFVGTSYFLECVLKIAQTLIIYYSMQFFSYCIESMKVKHQPVLIVLLGKLWSNESMKIILSCDKFCVFCLKFNFVGPLLRTGHLICNRSFNFFFKFS